VLGEYGEGLGRCVRECTGDAQGKVGGWRRGRGEEERVERREGRENWYRRTARLGGGRRGGGEECPLLVRWGATGEQGGYGWSRDAGATGGGGWGGGGGEAKAKRAERAERRPAYNRGSHVTCVRGSGCEWERGMDQAAGPRDARGESFMGEMGELRGIPGYEVYSVVSGHEGRTANAAVEGGKG